MTGFRLEALPPLKVLRWRLEHVTLLLPSKSERRDSARHNHDALTVSQAFLDVLFQTEQEGFLKSGVKHSILNSCPQTC